MPQGIGSRLGIWTNKTKKWTNYHSFYSILDDQTSQHKAEYGGDVGHRAVNLSLRRAPLMVQKLGITRTYLRFGTHALLCTAGGVVTFVSQAI